MCRNKRKGIFKYERMNEMNCQENENLEHLVHPFKTARRLLPGLFDDSAFVWIYDDEKAGKPIRLELRRNIRGFTNMYPAPTLQEILERMNGLKGIQGWSLKRHSEGGYEMLSPEWCGSIFGRTMGELLENLMSNGSES